MGAAKRIFLMILCVLFVASAVGCGKKAPPIAPEDVQKKEEKKKER